MSLMIDGWMPSVGSSSDQQLRPRHQGAADGELLLLAARKVAAAPAQHLLQHRETARRHRPVCCACRASAGAEAGLQILLDREQREDLAALRHEADAAPARARAAASGVMSRPSNSMAACAIGLLADDRASAGWSCRRRCGRARR